uniref:Centrosomal protein 20 n=1 Tax=Sus scrofa TaxID=9823 RepID=A0A8D0QWJ9_PIG
MATVAELKAVLKDTLEKRGVLGHLKARIRAEVFNALDDESEPRPSLSHENLLINELIREYLEFNKYKYTASVLIAESGQPVVPLDRQFLIRELNAFEESKDNTIPLLYGILAHFLRGTKDDIQKAFLKGSSLQPPNPNHGRQPSGRKQMGMSFLRLIIYLSTSLFLFLSTFIFGIILPENLSDSLIPFISNIVSLCYLSSRKQNAFWKEILERGGEMTENNS